MKKQLIALGIASLIGIGTFTVNASASDQEVEVKNIETGNYNLKNQGNGCNSLSEDQKKLIEKGYNELTDEEKDIFNKYREQRKRNLSEEQLNEFYKIQDKVHKYMDEDFKAQVQERRELRKNNKGQGRGCGNGQGQGQGQGKGSCGK